MNYGIAIVWLSVYHRRISYFCEEGENFTNDELIQFKKAFDDDN